MESCNGRVNFFLQGHHLQQCIAMASMDPHTLFENLSGLFHVVSVKQCQFSEDFPCSSLVLVGCKEDSTLDQGGVYCPQFRPRNSNIFVANLVWSPWKAQPLSHIIIRSRSEGFPPVPVCSQPGMDPLLVTLSLFRLKLVAPLLSFFLRIRFGPTAPSL